MNNNVFRIGIIGCGRIASRHIEACLSSTQVDLTVLVDPVEKHARSVADRFNITPHIKSDINDALGHMDVAIIATPNHLHKDAAICCMKAGVSTLIEKPLATCVKDGEEICRVGEENGVVAAVGYVTRFREEIQLLHSLLESDYFGRVRRFAYQAGTRGGWAPLSGYSLDRGATGGGVLVVTGTHFLDRMLYWFGFPNRSTLEYDSLGGPEANAFASFEYENSLGRFDGTARFSKTVKLPTGFVLETEKGTVLLGEGPDDKIRFWPNDRPELETMLSARGDISQNGLKDTRGLFQRQIEDFVAAVQEGHAPMVSVRDGLQSLQLLEDLYENTTVKNSDWYVSSLSQ